MKITFVFSGALAPANPHTVIRRDGSVHEMPSMFGFDDKMAVVECRVDELPTEQQLKTMAKLSQHAHEVMFAGMIGLHKTAVNAIISILD